MGVKRLTLACAALCMSFSAGAIAGPKTQLPLVQPASFECGYPQPYGSAWEDSNNNSTNPELPTPGNPSTTKYGGDLVAKVHYSWTCSDPLTSGEADLDVQTGLSTDPSQIYSYTCADPDADLDNFDHVCTGIVNKAAYLQSLKDATTAAVQARCPTGQWTFETGIAGLRGGVKSIDPGKLKTRQNYPVTYANEGCVFNDQQPQTCGNGVIEAPEQCDDGNTAFGDGCSAFCTLEN